MATPPADLIQKLMQEHGHKLLDMLDVVKMYDLYKNIVPPPNATSNIEEAMLAVIAYKATDGCTDFEYHINTTRLYSGEKYYTIVRHSPQGLRLMMPIPYEGHQDDQVTSES